MAKKGSSKSLHSAAASKNINHPKIYPPLPQGINRSELFRLWLSVCRHDPKAKQELYRLTANSKILVVIKQFIKERNDLLKAKHKGNPNASTRKNTAWEKMSSRSSGWVSTVSGGLPSLGKRR